MARTGGRIRGSLGGGSKPPQPRQSVEDDDTLSSRSTFRALLLVGEGHIIGTLPGNDIRKQIFLDDTPLQNQDGSLNFSSTTVEFRNGTLDQSPIPGFDQVESEQSVSTQVTVLGGAISRQISNPDANKVRVRVQVPSLRSINQTTGDITGTVVAFSIGISTQGGAFIENPLEINGKSSGPYERNYLFPLTTTGPWVIRITRTTPDSSSSYLENDLFWSAVTPIIDNKLSYPYSSIIGIVSQTQISKAGAYLYGAMVAVPNTYNPATRTYSGFWGGVFSARTYTNNPVWIYYDLLTTTRYGAGADIDASKVDIYSLYQISQYCDELVSDGQGGTESRFTCGCYITNAAEAYDVLNSLASIFRGITYWAQGQLICAQDAPVESVRQYSPSNVLVEYDEDGRLTKPPFTFSGTARRARHTVCLVTFFDDKDFSNPKIEVVRDDEAIARFGYREKELSAFGCTSRSQAQRAGRWLLISEQTEYETVSFEVATDGILVRPWDVVDIAAPIKSQKRIGGRISSATSATVTLDAPFTIESGKTYTLSVLNSSGIVVKRAVTSGSGTYLTLAVADFGFVPIAEGPWQIAASDLALRQYRIIGITENEDSYQLTGVLYNPSKHSAVDFETKVTTAQTTPTITPLQINPATILAQVF